MRTSNHPITAIVSASELFSRFITLATFDDKTADECKEIMLHRGEMFLKKLSEARNIIAKQCAQFVIDGCVSFHFFFDCSQITNNFFLSIFIACTDPCQIESRFGNIDRCRKIQ